MPGWATDKAVIKTKHRAPVLVLNRTGARCSFGREPLGRRGRNTARLTEKTGGRKMAYSGR